MLLNDCYETNILIYNTIDELSLFPFMAGTVIALLVPAMKGENIMERTGKQKKSVNPVSMVIRKTDRVQRLDLRAVAKRFPELKELIEIL